MHMLKLAIKMLIGNKASCLGVIFGVFLATLLISQQSAIFLGLVSRSYRLIEERPEPNIWIIDPATESDLQIRGMPKGYLNVVRSIPGIDWAYPINIIDIPMSTQTGIFQICQLYGIDDASLMGAPTKMLEGKILDLHRDNAVIIDAYSANEILGKTAPDGKKTPLKIGDSIEINNHRAVVVGICKVTQGFYPQPIIFTTMSQFSKFTFKDDIDFIMAKTSPKANVDQVLNRIDSFSTLQGLTSDQMEWRMAKYFLKTGLLINFGLSVALGIIIGFAIAGLIFYIMTLQNLKYYALIKAIGGNQTMISNMIAVQAGIVGIIGFLLGTGATLLWGFAINGTSLAFLFPWQLLVFTGLIVTIICLFTAGLSINRVIKADPIVLMSH